MDLDQIHTFLEIVRLKSFSKAAQTCYRTQPAISAQIRQLEQELNCSLFDRFGSRISVTTAGRIFADYGARILELRKQAQEEINELDRVPRGELMIAANESTCIYVLPGVFSEFKKDFPNVQVQVNRSYGSEVVKAVMDNLADFGFTQLPVNEPKLQVAQIHSEEVKLIVAAHHQLAGRRTVIAEELIGEALLLPRTGTTRTRLNMWLAIVEDELNISMELDSTEMMKRFALAGLGLTFLSESHVAGEVANGLLAAISLAPEPLVRRLGLIYRKDRPLSKASLGFIDVTLRNAQLPKAPVSDSEGHVTERKLEKNTKFA